MLLPPTQAPWLTPQARPPCVGAPCATALLRELQDLRHCSAPRAPPLPGERQLQAAPLCCLTLLASGRAAQGRLIAGSRSRDSTGAARQAGKVSSGFYLGRGRRTHSARSSANMGRAVLTKTDRTLETARSLIPSVSRRGT